MYEVASKATAENQRFVSKQIVTNIFTSTNIDEQHLKVKVSISSTFYEQILLQYSFAKK
jgi:hypothetical protein